MSEKKVRSAKNFTSSYNVKVINAYNIIIGIYTMVYEIQTHKYI